jgi:signal transduction histidine kinase
VGAVIVTTVATLVVAALALLGPLEHSLRRAALTTLETDVKGARGAANFQSLDLRYVLQASSPRIPDRTLQREQALGRQQKAELVRQQLDFGQRIGATVYLVGYPNPDGRDGRILAPPDNAAGSSAPWALIATAYRSRHSQYSFGSQDGGEDALAAIPFTKIYSNDTAHDLDGTISVRYVLAVSKPIDEINAAVAAVRVAFLTAALAGLMLTLLLAIPLAFTIVRRLRELRSAALQLAEGEAAVELPSDRGRDEVGDLARAFAVMQTQLRRQEEARRAFVATASHELRTPLTSLEGMLELLEEDLASSEPDLDDARDLLERARAQSHRLGRLAADLLDLSRIDAQVQLRSEPVELRELSRAVMAEFELGNGARAVNPTLQDDGDPVWALGDPGSVARILRILLDNALRVSPPGAEVTVALHNGEAAVLRVCDSGPGVPPEERSLIFERFQRGRNTSGQAGFGLGLAIGRELANRMGGELNLDDEPGPGATFTLRLPVAAAPEHDALLAH